jgi:hypothetical protein
MRVCRASTGGRSGGQEPTRAGMFFVGPRKHLSSPGGVALGAGTSSPFCDIVTSVLITNWRRPGTNLDGHQVRAQLGVSACRWAIQEQQKSPAWKAGAFILKIKLWRLSERTLGGSSPPATREHITK